MPKSWFSALAGGDGGSSSSGGSWRRRPHPRGPSASTAVDSSGKDEIIISSGDEEDQAPPQEQLRRLAEATLTDEEFVRQMELMTKHCSVRWARRHPRNRVRTRRNRHPYLATA